MQMCQFTKIEMASGSRESNAQAARPPSLIPTVVIRQAVQPILPTEDPLTISRQNSEREVEVSGESTNVTPTVSDQASGTSTVSNVSSGQTPSNASGTASSLNPDSQGGEQLQVCLSIFSLTSLISCDSPRYLILGSLSVGAFTYRLASYTQFEF